MALAEETRVLRARDVDARLVQDVEGHVQSFGEIGDFFRDDPIVDRRAESLRARGRTRNEMMTAAGEWGIDSLLFLINENEQARAAFFTHMTIFERRLNQTALKTIVDEFRLLLELKRDEKNSDRLDRSFASTLMI